MSRAFVTPAKPEQGSNSGSRPTHRRRPQRRRHKAQGRGATGRRQANAEAERHVAGLVGVATSDVCVVRGASGSSKVVFVRGVGPEEVSEILSGHVL